MPIDQVVSIVQWPGRDDTLDLVFGNSRQAEQVFA